MSRKKVAMTLGIPEEHNVVLGELGRLVVAHGSLGNGADNVPQNTGEAGA